MKIREIINSRIARLLNVDAITIYPFIFYRDKIDLKVQYHEFVHVEQVEKLGWLFFYFDYLKRYFELRRFGYSKAKAYFEISYEKDARYQTEIAFKDLSRGILPIDPRKRG